MKNPWRAEKKRNNSSWLHFWPQWLKWFKKYLTNLKNAVSAKILHNWWHSPVSTLGITVSFRSIRPSRVTRHRAWPKLVACPVSQADWPTLKNHWLAVLYWIWNFSKMANLNGRNFWLVTGHMLTGRCQNFVHLVTCHTLGRSACGKFDSSPVVWYYSLFLLRDFHSFFFFSNGESGDGQTVST